MTDVNTPSSRLPNPAERVRTGIEEIDRALAAHYDRLSNGQRRVIDRLLSDARYGAVISAPELARTLGVSESTVTRAAQTLGFAGYPDLQRRLRQRFVAPVAERLAPRDPNGSSADGIFAQVLLDDAARIREMAEDISGAEIQSVVERLLHARQVFVFGERGSHGLALMLGIGLRMMLEDVRVLNQTAGDLPDQLIGIGSDDVALAISFRRVDRMTVQVLKHANTMGAATIALTDHGSSPAARAARHALIARTGTLRLMPSFAPGASLINAILEEVAARTRQVAAARLDDAERLWREFGSYAEE